MQTEDDRSRIEGVCVCVYMNIYTGTYTYSCLKNIGYINKRAGPRYETVLCHLFTWLNKTSSFIC